MVDDAAVEEKDTESFHIELNWSDDDGYVQGEGSPCPMRCDFLSTCVLLVAGT